MVSQATIAPHVALPKPRVGQTWGIKRADIPLTGGTVRGVFRVFGGPCVILAAYMEISQAVANTACNMSWIFNSDVGGDRTIGDTVNIANAAIGDFFYAECDGTNLIKCTTGTGLITAGPTWGCVVTKGSIDIVLSASPATGKGTLYLNFLPIAEGATICPEDYE